MDIKANPNSAAHAAAEAKKGEKALPKRSFKELLARGERPRTTERRRSIFDVASKENKKPQQKKKNPTIDQSGHAAEAARERAAEAVAQSAAVKGLSEEMYGLIDKMANFIAMEKNNGISTTTVSVDMEDSIFDGSEIVIDHYDTHPHSFNLQLIGNPESMEVFSAHLASLQTSLQGHQALQGFQVHVLPPIIGEKSDLYDRGLSKEERKKALKKSSTKKIPS